MMYYPPYIGDNLATLLLAHKAVRSLEQVAGDSSLHLFQDLTLHRTMIVDIVQERAYFRGEDRVWYSVNLARLMAQIARYESLKSMRRTLGYPYVQEEQRLDAKNLLIFARTSIERELEPEVAKTLEYFLN